jgi:hypothetical protein
LSSGAIIPFSVENSNYDSGARVAAIPRARYDVCSLRFHKEKTTMSFRPGIILIILFCAALLAAMQQTPNSTSQAAGSQAGVANAAENAQFRQLANTRADDVQALRDDIKRMRAMVGQMESNLAFVDTTQSPLKHQFQLDIDMWNILINQMERRAQANPR